MALINFQQEDTSADSGVNIGCSGSTLGTTNFAKEMIQGGTAGTVEVLPDPVSGADRANVMFQSDTGTSLPTTWGSGDYVVRLNITSARSGAVWAETHICERTSGGTYNTVASLTGQADSLSTGVKTHTVNRGTDYAASANSTLYIVLVITGPAHGGTNYGFTPDQIINTPIDDGVGGGAALFMHHFKQMANN
jgi:hypothetical protein